MDLMFSKRSLVVLLLGSFCVMSFAAKGSDLMAEERIGNLRLGLTEADVKKAIDGTLKRGPENLWGADGMYHQAWQCPSRGLDLGMVSEKRGGKKVVESITVTAPCALASKRGLRIGSTEQEVRKAYKKDWNREDSSQDSFVAGSVYGGIIFRFRKGKVDQIFLGAAAE